MPTQLPALRLALLFVASGRVELVCETIDSETDEEQFVMAHWLHTLNSNLYDVIRVTVLVLPTGRCVRYVRRRSVEAYLNANNTSDVNVNF